MRVGVVGATGYAGAEVMRLCASHDDLDVVLATGGSNAGKSVSSHVPALAALYPDTLYAPTDALASADLDVVFLALPHGESQAHVPALVERGVTVVDLGADFRLRDAADYDAWYGGAHQAPQLLSRAVYGLVERHRAELAGASLIAAPGCYPTATALAMGPFADAKWIDTSGVVVNALSGVSGAGRSASDRLHFPRLSGNAEAYGLLNHRHTIEMQRELKVELLFTPHLVPVSRGMLVTAYARLLGAHNTAEALALLRETYRHDPCVVVTDEPPSLKDGVGSNLCFVSARVDERTGWLVVMSSIDNLIKGAAGQAIQAWNVATERPETMGLPLAGVTP